MINFGGAKNDMNEIGQKREINNEKRKKYK